jgi:hypothetical protein
VVGGEKALHGLSHVRSPGELTWNHPAIEDGCEVVDSFMISLNLQHRTRYRYRTPVNIGRHRLMLRPRESRDVRLISYDLAIKPQAALTWAYDVFGNAVGSAKFQDQTDELVITSTATLELAAVPWPIFDIAAYAISYPFRYSNEEWIDLGL